MWLAELAVKEFEHGGSAMKSHTEYLVFETRKRREMVHITDEVEQIVRRSGIKDELG